MAAGAGFHLAVGRAAAAAGGAVLDSGSGYFLFAAESGLLKGQLQPGHNVFAPAGCVLGGAPAPAAAEEIPEYVRKAAEITEAAKASGTGAGIKVGVHPREAELIIAGPLVGIGQYLVGFAYLLELFLGCLIPGVPVGMVLHGHFPVGFLYVIGAGALVHTQHLVIITFVFCHTFHLSQSIDN